MQLFTGKKIVPTYRHFINKPELGSPLRLWLRIRILRIEIRLDRNQRLEVLLALVASSRGDLLGAGLDNNNTGTVLLLAFFR